jgi:hypothetical protein
MPNKTIARAYGFPSESKPGKNYETLEYTDGTHSCNCPGWKFKQKTTPDGQRTCRHTRLIDAGTAAQHATSVADYNANQAKAEAQASRRANPTQLGTRPEVPILTERTRRAFDLEEA